MSVRPLDHSRASRGTPGSSTRRDRRQMSRRTQLTCAYMAVPLLLLLCGFPYSGLLVPPNPAAGAAEVARMYRENLSDIRLGLAVASVGFILFFPFACAIIAQSRRIEGTPVLAYTQTAAVGASAVIFLVPWTCWLTAAFRPERDIELILLLSDFGWMFFVYAGFIPFCAWNFFLGLAILSDTRRKPVFPRWSGYFSIWLAILFLCDVCVPFFKDGPFSWRGAMPYWFPFAVFAIWVVVMMVLTAKAINAESEENRQFDEVDEPDTAVGQPGGQKVDEVAPINPR